MSGSNRNSQSLLRNLSLLHGRPEEIHIQRLGEHLVRTGLQHPRQTHIHIIVSLWLLRCESAITFMAVSHYLRVLVALHGVASEPDDHPTIAEFANGFDGGGSVHVGHLIVHHHHVEHFPIAKQFTVILNTSYHFRYELDITQTCLLDAALPPSSFQSSPQPQPRPLLDRRRHPCHSRSCRSCDGSW